MEPATKDLKLEEVDAKINAAVIELQLLRSKKRKLQIESETKLKKLLPPINSTPSGSTQHKITSFFTESSIVSSIKRPEIPSDSSFMSSAAGDDLEISTSKPNGYSSTHEMEEQKGEFEPIPDHDPRVLWAENFRSKVSALFKEKTIVFNLYGGKIPMRTLYFWKKSPSKRLKSGRKTPYEDMEDHLFEWFLIARARQIAIRDQDLAKKAEKISTQYSTRALDSGDLEYAQLYAEFKFSNGWLWRFKRRRKLTRRAVTTKIKRSYED
jgi:hypothetical protein